MWPWGWADAGKVPTNSVTGSRKMISGTGRDPNTKPLEMLECFVCAAQAIAYGPFDNLKLCQENNYICLAKEENNTLCRFVVGDTT